MIRSFYTFSKRQPCDNTLWKIGCGNNLSSDAYSFIGACRFVRILQSSSMDTWIFSYQSFWKIVREFLLILRGESNVVHLHVNKVKIAKLAIWRAEWLMKKGFFTICSWYKGSSFGESAIRYFVSSGSLVLCTNILLSISYMYLLESFQVFAWGLMKSTMKRDKRWCVLLPPSLESPWRFIDFFFAQPTTDIFSRTIPHRNFILSFSRALRSTILPTKIDIISRINVFFPCNTLTTSTRMEFARSNNVRIEIAWN